MDDDSKYSTSKLEKFPYRHLQQLAKTMNLPSNVKKVYLVEMINAKKCSPESEVQRIVRRVKLERQHLTQIKKRSRRTVIPPDTSSEESKSPPITNTPKRAPFMPRCSELRHQIVRPQNNLPRTTATTVPSDRVLRSCNVKTVKRSYINKYEIKEKTQDMVDRGTQMNVMRVVRKYKPNTPAAQMSKDMQLVPAMQIGSTQIVVKRQRLLSGIYPIGDELVQVGGVGVRASDGKMATLNAFVRRPPQEKGEQTHTSCQDDSPIDKEMVQVGGVGVRANDGKMATLNAFVRRPPQDKGQQTHTSTGMRRNIELTIQDLINGNVDAKAASLNYPNTTGVTNRSESEYTEITPGTSSSVYYHKKIRAEQVRERRMSSVNTRWSEPSRTYPERYELPRIGDAFNQFRGQHEARDVTQPIYVQVGGETERILHNLHTKDTLLETIYNFKNNFLTGQTLLKPAADTKCVFSTPVVITAAPHRAAAPAAEPDVASYERDNYYGNTDKSQVTDCPGFEFRCQEEKNIDGSSIGTIESQELGANVTISDMVEDALELISQDGDYMERMGMDVRMQCVLCNWAGPKIILEYHIRKDHPNEIDRQEKREWNITYTLGSLVSQQLWRCRVISHGTSLYVLSVKHEPPGRFLATLSSLSPEPELTTCSITIFNKVSGEPYSWWGEIHELPTNLPYDTQPGLEVNLGNLDLIPNSANLKFLNGELVSQSPSKVIFGQLELNDIHIILFVKLSD